MSFCPKHLISLIPLRVSLNVFKIGVLEILSSLVNSLLALKYTYTSLFAKYPKRGRAIITTGAYKRHKPRIPSIPNIQAILLPNSNGISKSIFS